MWHLHNKSSLKDILEITGAYFRKSRYIWGFGHAHWSFWVQTSLCYTRQWLKKRRKSAKGAYFVTRVQMTFSTFWPLFKKEGAGLFLRTLLNGDHNSLWYNLWPSAKLFLHWMMSNGHYKAKFDRYPFSTFWPLFKKEGTVLFLRTLLNVDHNNLWYNLWPFAKLFLHWIMSNGHYRAKGTQPMNHSEIKSHSFYFFSNTRAETKNPVICIAPWVSADQFEYQWATVLHEYSCRNDQKSAKGAYYDTRVQITKISISREPINISKK